MRTLPRNVSMMTGLALTVFGIVLSHEAPAASPVLQAGTYHFAAASDTLCGLADLGLSGSQIVNTVATLVYSGAGKAGSTISVATSSGSFSFGQALANVTLSVLKLPPVPTTGPASWTGAYSGSAYARQSDNGSAPTPKVIATSGTATLKLTTLSTTAFYGTLTLKTKSATCTAQIVGVP